MFAAAVLAIAISGAASAMVSAIQLDRVNRETAAATQEARRVLEQITDVDLDQAWAVYNKDPNDDPVGVVAAGNLTGSTFKIQGLAYQKNDPDAQAGEVMLPAAQNGVGVWELREDFVDAALGMPMDLNGDGAIDNLDHSGDYILLPVRVRVQWNGVTGDRTLDLVTILSNR